MTNKEATRKTTSALLSVARAHFAKYGYFEVALEKIVEEANVTRGAVYHHFKNKQGLFVAVLESVQEEVATQIQKQALKSNEAWEQLILGCVGFIKAANAKGNRQILLVDAPAVLGWEVWRSVDAKHSMNVLQAHIEELKAQGYLRDKVDTQLMTFALSGALNELALQFCANSKKKQEKKLLATLTQFVSGFRKD